MDHSICLCASVLFLSDFLFILFRISWWPSARKELSSWLSACAVLLCAVLIVCVPFPFAVWDRMWNSIVSVSDHYLFVYVFTIFHLERDFISLK